MEELLAEGARAGEKVFSPCFGIFVNWFFLATFFYFVPGFFSPTFFPRDNIWA